MSFDPSEYVDKMPKGFKFEERLRKKGKFEGSKDKYFTKHAENGKKMYTIVGQKKAEQFIKAYEECNDEYLAAVDSKIIIAKWVKDENENITKDLTETLKTTGTPKRKDPQEKPSPIDTLKRKASQESTSSVKPSKRSKQSDNLLRDSSDDDEGYDEYDKDDLSNDDDNEEEENDNREQKDQDDKDIEILGIKKTTPSPKQSQKLKTKQNTPEFTKFPARIPKHFGLHTYFIDKYSKNESDFICGVVGIDSPTKLVEYDQNRLACELEHWWNLQDRNPFDRYNIEVNLDFCRGMVYSWYLKAKTYID